MKKLLLTLIVSIAMCGSIFAQYDSHWPDFYYPAFSDQTALVAAIVIDGEIVTTENHPDNWNALEIAFFVGDECRGAGVAFGDYNPAVNYLTNEYVEEWGDPFPTIDGAPIYFDEMNQVVTVKMYDHVNGIEYNECTVTLLGEPYEILTGGEHLQGYWDPENPIMLNFTTPATGDCEKIVLDEANPSWDATFENEDLIPTPTRWTFQMANCWTVAEQYTSAVLNEIGEQADTLPQVYRGFNTTEGGQYSLRMHFRSLVAMPELDENVDLAKVHLSMNVRQPYWSYKLQVGIITDINNPDESFVPVAVVNNPTKNMTHFECGFWTVKDLIGEGRYIAFKNIGGSEGDPYCTNYLDDIVLTYKNCAITMADMPWGEEFEGLTELSGATGYEPTCWDLIAEDVALESTTKPQVYRGFNTTSGGNYSLRMRNRCIYAMPELSLGTPAASDFSVKMTLKVRQPNELYRLQVGVLDEEDNFTVVKTIHCDGTGMEAFSVIFPGLTTGRIAFRNTLVPSTGMATDYYEYSYNYLDGVHLELIESAKVGESESGMTDSESSLEDITVYPNPTTGVLHIDAMEVQEVECYNAMGQLVGMYNNARDIDLSSFADGVYTLRITVPQGVTMRKVVKR